MPLLDSFTVDHTRMPAPAVRKAKVMRTPCGDKITVFDLRFYRPNVKKMSGKGIHTLEHLFAGFIREHLNGKGVEIDLKLKMEGLSSVGTGRKQQKDSDAPQFDDDEIFSIKT